MTADNEATGQAWIKEVTRLKAEADYWKREAQAAHHAIAVLLNVFGTSTEDGMVQVKIPDRVQRAVGPTHMLTTRYDMAAQATIMATEKAD